MKIMRRHVILLIASWLALLGATQNQAFARTIIVAPNGSDDNDQATLSAPLASPARALEMAAPGDTIYLRAGHYYVTKSLWLNKDNLTFASYPGEMAYLYGYYEERPDSPTSVVTIVANRVSLLNLDIYGGSYYGVKVDLDGTATSTMGVRIRGCRIHNTGRDCIKTFNADQLLIEDCEIGPSGLREPRNAEGIDSIGSVGVTIRNCYVHDTTTNGIYLKGGARDGLIERCRVENTGDFGGILLGQDTDLEFMRDGTQYEVINCEARNNIVRNTGAAGMATYSGSNVRFYNNTLFDVARVGQAGFYVVMNTREVPSQQVTFKNNIVVVCSNRALVRVVNLADAFHSDSNIYYHSLGNALFLRETWALDRYEVWNFAQWQEQMKVDAHSALTNPLLDVGNLLRPLPSSPALDRGEALPEVLTDFAGTARPQGVASDIGAYEQPVSTALSSNTKLGTKSAKQRSVPKAWTIRVSQSSARGLKYAHD
jgi:hypothetical protein